MSAVYNLCEKLIAKGRTDGLQEKLDVYLACDRLTAQEYETLTAMLNREA